MSEEIVIELVARERIYAPGELAAQLGIGMSTLRKWSALLEQNGYSFLRDSRGRREYRQADTIALRKMRDCIKESLMPLESAAAEVAASMSRMEAHAEAGISRQEVAATAEVLPMVATHPKLRRGEQSFAYQMLEQRVDLLARHVQQQDEQHAALLERLDKQERYISINLKERDRRLMKAMDEILKNKIAIAALKDSERKKSIWHWLFRIR